MASTLALLSILITFSNPLFAGQEWIDRPALIATSQVTEAGSCITREVEIQAPHYFKNIFPVSGSFIDFLKNDQNQPVKNTLVLSLMGEDTFGKLKTLYLQLYSKNNTPWEEEMVSGYLNYSTRAMSSYAKLFLEESQSSSPLAQIDLWPCHEKISN